jgi:hypothetical protein
MLCQKQVFATLPAKYKYVIAQNRLNKFATGY